MIQTIHHFKQLWPCSQPFSRILQFVFIEFKTMLIFIMFTDILTKHPYVHIYIYIYVCVCVCMCGGCTNISIYMYISWFYGISNFVGYLMPNPFLCK